MKRIRKPTILRPLDYMKRVMDKRYRGIHLDNSPPALLSESTLQVADVLFCRGENRLIRYGSSGHYVHAAIYLGDGVVAEATTKGVKACALSEFIARYTYVAVTRAPGLTREPGIPSAVVAFCQKHISAGTPYDFIGAGFSPMREFIELVRASRSFLPPEIRDFHERKRTFCSQFVLDAFIAADYFGGLHPNSAARSPTALAEENCFWLKGYLLAAGNLNLLVKDDLLWTGGG